MVHTTYRLVPVTPPRLRPARPPGPVDSHRLAGVVAWCCVVVCWACVLWVGNAMGPSTVNTAGFTSLEFVRVVVELLLFALVGGVIVWERVTKFRDERTEHGVLLDRLLNPVPASERLHQLGNGGPTDLPIKEIGQRVLLTESRLDAVDAKLETHAAYVRQQLETMTVGQAALLNAIQERPCMVGLDCPVPGVAPSPH